MDLIFMMLYFKRYHTQDHSDFFLCYHPRVLYFVFKTMIHFVSFHNRHKVCFRCIFSFPYDKEKIHQKQTLYQDGAKILKFLICKTFQRSFLIKVWEKSPLRYLFIKSSTSCSLEYAKHIGWEVTTDVLVLEEKCYLSLWMSWINATLLRAFWLQHQGFEELRSSNVT